MITVVAIDVPPDLAPAIANEATGSCQNAIGAGRCVLSGAGKPTASDEKTDAGPSWYALVRADKGEHPTLRIEFRKRSLAGPLVAERSLSFSDRDGPGSRWASAGLVIAGLVAAEDAASKPSSEAHEKDETPHQAPTAAHPTLRWGVDAGMLSGQGLQHGSFRLGALARGWVGAPDSGMMGALTMRYAQRGGSASLTWWSVSAGVGARLGSKQSLLNAELIGDVVVERMLVSAVDPQLVHEDSGGQSRFGGRIGATMTARLTGDLRFLLGVDAAAMTPPVDIQVKSTPVGREPAVRFSMAAGFRLDL